MSKADVLYKVLEPEQNDACIERMWHKIYAQRISDGTYRQQKAESYSSRFYPEENARQVVSIAGNTRTNCETGEVKKKFKRTFGNAWVWPLAAALIVATMVGLFFMTAPTQQALKLVNNRAIPDTVFTQKQKRFEFVDGSSIISQPDTNFKVVSNHNDAIAFSLKKGKMSFEVTPNRHRKWTVYCGVISVNVVGTKFKVRRNKGRVSVDVSRGTVVVKGYGIPGGLQKLTAGMNLEVAEKPDGKRLVNRVGKKTAKSFSIQAPGDNANPDTIFNAPWMVWESTILPAVSSVSTVAKEISCTASVYEAQSMAGESTDENGGGENNVQSAVGMMDDPANGRGESRVRGNRKVQPSASWKKLAESGKFGDAYQLLSPETFSNLHDAAWSESELFAMSDIARATGHMQQSCAALDTLLEKYPHSSRAGLAAYTLARIQLDSLRNPDSGKRYLEQAIESGLSRTLRETAIYRLIQLYREKNPAKARGFASAYLADYPNGRYFEQITETMNSLKK
jgi:hypothetical protein